MLFSVEDIHKIREADYEATKNLTHEELIARTNQNAQRLLRMISQADDNTPMPERQSQQAIQ